MRSSERRGSFLLLTGILAGCSSSPSDGASPPDTTEPHGSTTPDGGGVDAAPRPEPTFLDPSSYASLLVIDGRLPYGVTRKHAADDAIAGSRWGRHGGPMVTTSVYGATGTATSTVVRWSLPTGAADAASRKAVPITTATGLPATFFYGADGMVDLPFGASSLLSYTGSGAPYRGEALLYGAEYTTVSSRAKANGFYSGIGVTDGARQRIIHSSLSTLGATDSATSDSGLYAAEICAGSLAPSSACLPPSKLFGWNGASGPVASDTHGNVFVGASTSDGARSDTVYGLSKAQTFAVGAQTPGTIASVSSGGTSSIAALPPVDALEGWVLGLGFGPASAIYAASFIESGASVTTGSTMLGSAITKGADAEALSVFSDDEGDLWVAVTTKTSGVFVELRRRVP